MIYFRALAPGGSPDATGDAYVSLRLTSMALQNFGVGLTTDAGWAVRSLRLSSNATGWLGYASTGEYLTGGAGAMPALRTFALEAPLATGMTIDGYAIGSLPLLASHVLDDQLELPTPQDGQGDAAMPALSTSATGFRGVISSDASVALRLKSFSMETALSLGTTVDGYAIGTLPPLFGSAMETAPVLDAFVLLLGPPAYLSGFADETQGYLVESLTIEESMVGQLVAALSDLIESTDTWTSQARRVALVSELLNLSTPLRIALEAVTTDSLVVSDLSVGTLLRLVSLRDALLATGVATSARDAEALLADALALTDVLVSVQNGDITSDLALAEALTVLRHAAALVVEEAVLAETMAGLAFITVLVPDSFDIDAAATASATRLAAAIDGLDVAISFEFGGESYLGLSMNTSLRGITEYDNFAFDSLASFDGSLYGANDSGVFLLDGEDDDGTPIDAFLRTAMQRVAQGQAASITDTYLGFRGNGQLQLKVVVANAVTGGEQKAYVFDLVQSPAGAPLPGRFKVGKGLKSVYMAFELSNTEGADFAIDVMEVRPLVSYRRLS